MLTSLVEYQLCACYCTIIAIDTIIPLWVCLLLVGFSKPQLPAPLAEKGILFSLSSAPACGMYPQLSDLDRLLRLFFGAVFFLLT